MNVYSPRNIRITYGDVNIDTGTKSGCIPRMFFDNILFEKASSIVDKVLTGYKVTEVSSAGKMRKIKLRKISADEEIEIDTDLIIAADGAKSTVANKIGMLASDIDHYFDGLRVYYDGGSFDPALHIFYDRRTLPGYIWIFPISKDRANVGIMMKKRINLKEGENIRKIFIEVLQTNPAISEILKEAKPNGKIEGAPLPLGTLPGPRIADNIIFIGGAAAFIHPITGGGIYYGILSAKYVAKYGSQAIYDGDLSTKYLQNYEKWWRKEILPGFQYAHSLKRLFGSEKFLNWYIRKASAWRSFYNLFLMVYGSPLPRHVFWNPKFWAKVVLA
jgi:flavin-dependent dehydrogenase